MWLAMITSNEASEKGNMLDVQASSGEMGMHRQKMLLGGRDHAGRKSSARHTRQSG
tara:strand:- start:292 stop:459 length:168 start_codon:yes stop_codon:yes gene_type:complete